MPKSHNKKRNVGIIYELLLRRVSRSLVEGDMKKAQESLDMISRRFKQGTELYKEFRLFKALLNSRSDNERVAKSILSESRAVACSTDLQKLRKEVSDLIREINYTFNDRSFYSAYLPNYKKLATVQTLLNDWREPASYNIERLARYESKMIESIMEQEGDQASLSDQINPDVDSLVIKIMTEKINSRYDKVFTEDQKKILKLYAFYGDENSQSKLQDHLSEVKTKSLESLNHLRSVEDNKTLMSKIDQVSERIQSESIENIGDVKIERFLTLIDLCNQIKESVNEATN